MMLHTLASKGCHLFLLAVSRGLQHLLRRWQNDELAGFTAVRQAGSVLSLAYLAFPGVGAAQIAPTLDEVIEGLERRERLFFESDGLIIHYERVRSTDLIKTVASGGLLPAEWTIAYQGGTWLVQRHLTEDLGQKTCLIRDGAMMDWSDDVVNLVSYAGKSNIYAGLYYTRNLSLDAPKHVARSGGASGQLENIRRRYADHANLPFLPEFLRENKAKYRVNAEPEDFDGIRCWAVEWPGMDRFHVAVELGYAIPRRIFCWGPEQPSKYEIHNSDYTEVKRGLWLPYTQTVDRYASIIAEEKAVWGKVACRSEYNVNVIEFGKVPQDVFKVKLPPGTLVFDHVREIDYVVPGDGSLDPFSEPVGKAREFLHRGGRIWLASVVAFLLVVVAFYALTKGKFRRQET